MRIGKVSGSELKRSVLRQIHTKRKEVVSGAAIGVDCAIFSFSEADFMASCMQQGTVRVACEGGQDSFTGVSISQLIHKTVNNLVCSGAEPIAIMMGLILPQDTEEFMIKSLMAEAEDCCRQLQLQIAGGHTTVSADVNLPQAVITGYGKVSGDTCKTVKGVKPGQDIVISKWIGLEGTALLARKNKEKLLGRYPAYLVEEAMAFDRYLSMIPEAATAMKSGVCAMHDASEGGIFASLWELAEGAGVGLTIDIKKLPLRQETVEVCECLGVNPYELLSGGSLIMTANDGQALVAALQKEQIPAVVVGKITDSNDRIILNEDEVRYMDRPKQDEIYREFDNK